MTRRWIAGLVGIFVGGLALGLLAGLLLFGGDSNNSDSTAACEEARSVVDQSVDAMEEISDTEDQDRSFFAAMIVEQRTITYAMTTRPNCFTLQERAGAEGLLDGIRGLLDNASG